MKTVTVIGAGIVGLTSALKLQEKGFAVTLLSREDVCQTLSSKVGAIWFPFEVHPKEKANTWASLAYTEYQNDCVPGNGVSFIPFMTSYGPESNTDWTTRLPKGTVRKAESHELPSGISAAFVATVPLAEPLLYLPYLLNLFTSRGGTFIQKSIGSFQDPDLNSDLIVNCTGLGAKALCQDEDLHPMRGQILRCKKLAVPSCADSIKKGALSYVINRSTDSVVGGTDYDQDWNLEVDPNDTQLIVDRLISGGLAEKQPEILEEIVGLRPKRSEVRFEFDAVQRNLFHNYGHGGAGFTVAWGCAIELAEIVASGATDN